ncbi:MAG: hypothetical protein NTZ67_02785 [Gammaproteobacteria bacterium]|nr:hypothetical protein [Gammaproteobacteria bacterium]
MLDKPSNSKSAGTGQPASKSAHTRRTSLFPGVSAAARELESPLYTKQRLDNAGNSDHTKKENVYPHPFNHMV